ncbi:MAG: CBS domain-containing protein [Actinomycetota bacterium]
MRAREIMTAPVVTVRHETPVKEAAALLVQHGINAMPVTDEKTGIVGIVSERDLLPLETEPDPRLHVIVPRSRPHVPATVAEVMTREVVTMAEESDVADVARAMLDAHVKQVPIVSSGKVVGIIARRDLLRILARDDTAIEADVQAMLDGSTGVIGAFRARVSGGVVTLDGPPDERDRRLAERLARCVPGVVAAVFADESPPPVTAPPARAAGK